MKQEFPQFQYSVFIGQNREGQIVVRADTYAELVSHCAQMGIILPVTPVQQASTPLAVGDPTQEPPHPATENSDAWCAIHQIMMNRIEGQYGVFYSHTLGKDAQGKYRYCKGK